MRVDKICYIVPLDLVACLAIDLFVCMCETVCAGFFFVLFH